MAKMMAYLMLPSVYQLHRLHFQPPKQRQMENKIKTIYILLGIDLCLKIPGGVVSSWKSTSCHGLLLNYGDVFNLFITRKQ